MTGVRSWVKRITWAVLAVPASAMVTAGVWGIAYGVGQTPAWWNPLVVSFGALIAVGALLSLVAVLVILLEDWHDRDYGKLEMLAAVCVGLTTWALCSALHQQALHDRGRVERAVVASVHPTGDGMGQFTGNVAVVKDSSGHTLAGQIDAARLAVGDSVTVTVDPDGKYGVESGPPPRAPELVWEAAAALAALQALLCAAIGFYAAGPRKAPPPRPVSPPQTVLPAS